MSKRKCDCCGEVFKMTSPETEWAWKLDGKFYCRFSCYSKEFDKKYKASRVCIGMNRVNTGTRTRVVDNYERIR